MNKINHRTDSELYSSCDCGCGNGIHFNFKLTPHDNEVIFETVVSGHTAYQNNSWWQFKRRLKAAWFMLRGKEYILHEVIINQYDWTNFVETINKLTDQNFIEKGDYYYDVT